jgi:hypothetical protein
MDFIIIINNNDMNINNMNIKVNYVNKLSNYNDSGIYILKLSHAKYIDIVNNSSRIIQFGDIIDKSKKGLFYTIKINSISIEINSDIFGYLPIFYSIYDNKIIVSSDF